MRRVKQIYHYRDSEHYKSHWRKFSYKQVMHCVENSATIKSLSREFSYTEFSYTQVTVERVQLQTNYPLEWSATNKTLCRVFNCNKSTFRAISNEQINTNLPVERSARNKLPCREIGYKQINLQRDQLHTNQLVESSATNKLPCREIGYKQISL